MTKAFLFPLNNNENGDIFSPESHHPGVNIKCSVWVKKAGLKSSRFPERLGTGSSGSTPPAPAIDRSGLTPADVRVGASRSPDL